MSHDLPLAVALNGYGVTHDEPDGIWREMLRWEDLAALARTAERLGFASILVPEIGGREAFSTVAALAAVTERIGLASGVVPLRARDDHRTAMGASSLFEQSGGRFVLGLGSDLTIAETRRRISTIRQLVHGDDAIVDDPEEGVIAVGQLDWFTYEQRVPIWLAALGPRMVELGAEVADGLVLNWCTPERVAEVRSQVGGRDGFTIAVYVRACIGPGEAATLGALRLEAARYVRLAPYEAQFRRMGLWGEAERPPAWEWDRAWRLADRVVDATCVRGEPQAGVARLREYRDAGADLVVVYPVAAGEAVSSIQGTLMAVAPEPAVEA